MRTHKRVNVTLDINKLAKLDAALAKKSVNIKRSQFFDACMASQEIRKMAIEIVRQEKATTTK